jgi:proteasome accessory factor B
VGDAPGSTDLVTGLAPRVRPGGGALGPLMDAVHERRVVRFTYRAANTGAVRERVVEPWRLLARRGGWVLVGRDRDRDASRSFRLSRIEGSVRTVGEPGAFPPPAEDELAAAMASWATGAQQVATLAVRPERAGATRARAVQPPQDAPDWTADPVVGPLIEHRDVVHVLFRSAWELAEELVGYGDAVLVLAPGEVRHAVLRLLRTAATLDERTSVDG